MAVWNPKPQRPFASDELDFASYEDEYVVKLRQLIDLKVAGKQVVQATESEEPQIINFMEALKKSVAEAQTSVAAAASKGKSTKSASKKSSKTSKKQAPSAKKKSAKKASKKAKKKSG